MSVVSLPNRSLKLNSEQELAAKYGVGDQESNRALLIVAGAGTGKTTTLAHRVANLLVAGTDPRQILLLTFSRQAARTLVDRAKRVARQRWANERGSMPDLHFPWAGTFHSVANTILRRYATTLGLDPQFTVLGRGDAADLIDVLRSEHHLDRRGQRFPTKNTCLAIYSRRVNAQRPLEDCLRTDYPWCLPYLDELSKLFRAYVQRKRDLQALDYDDLLLYWFFLTREPEIAVEIGNVFTNVLVDEYQDTNLLQAEIIKAIKPDGTGVTVVGDEAQSIYGFRAADVHNILRFPDQYPAGAHVISLERNYRSTAVILDCANAIINQAKLPIRKHLYSSRKEGAIPRYVQAEDQTAEADYVVQEVLCAREAGALLRDQAVLFRNANHSDQLELELTRRGIPYRKYGGLKFLEAAHVKDILAVLKWGDNPKNEIAAQRVLKLLPGVGPKTAERYFAALAQQDFDFAALHHCRCTAAQSSFDDLVGTLTAISSTRSDDPAWSMALTKARAWYEPLMADRFEDAEQRLADLEQLQVAAERYPDRLKFVTELTLDPPQATGDLAGQAAVDEDYLVLSTVHSAKGQEWRNVFLLNVTDGNFPNEFSTGSEEGIEEERRLLYVAATRARDNLHFCVPFRFRVTAQHRHGDKHVYGAKSRFFNEAVMQTVKRCSHANPVAAPGAVGPRSDHKLDISGRLDDMWR